jgi:hypothetical protein
VLIQGTATKFLSYFYDLYFIFYEFPKMENAQVQIRKGSWSLLHWTWANAIAPCNTMTAKERKRRTVSPAQQ